MATAIITTDDLYEFKMELMEEIKQLFQEYNNHSTKKWMRTSEVLKLLGMSPSTLQNLRLNGTIPYTKIGRSLFYDYNEIMQVLEKNRVENIF
ncbi:MAG: helix-turn-helix domain-containing protein [Flavobacteriaceae bacterium]|jgi:predicted DNA-binding transcriptional regulator AlpA|nr:helix-turn-helix domain-containing protein [Flavobacteriaceae bacterium]